MAVRPENPSADESAGKETKLNLEDLTYKTEEECLDIIARDPNNKDVLDNLVNLYLLRSKMLNRANELYKNGDYQGAVQEYNKALLIEPGNKKAKMGMKRAQCRMK